MTDTNNVPLYIQVGTRAEEVARLSLADLLARPRAAMAETLRAVADHIEKEEEQ